MKLKKKLNQDLPTVKPTPLPTIQRRHISQITSESFGENEWMCTDLNATKKKNSMQRRTLAPRQIMKRPAKIRSQTMKMTLKKRESCNKNHKSNP